MCKAHTLCLASLKGVLKGIAELNGAGLIEANSFARFAKPFAEAFQDRNCLSA